MMSKVNYTISFFLLGFLFISCSDIKDNVSTPSEVSAHGEGFSKAGTPEFHGVYIRNSNWNLESCKQCHASNYSGGMTGASCLKCHTSAEGPEACNTCHGSFGNPEMISPPRDIDGNIETTVRGVGAHSSHLYENEITNKLPCNECHKVPQNLYDPGHVDSQLPAEVILGDLSKRNGSINAIYNTDDQTCSNTYCHGNFVFYRDSTVNQYMYDADKIVGNNVTVKWNQSYGSQGVCGSCHGLPPTGHYGPLEVVSCYRCHKEVVDDKGNIIDKTKHVNGKVEYNSPIH